MRGARSPPPPDVAVVGINSGTGRALGLPRMPPIGRGRVPNTSSNRIPRALSSNIDFSRPKTVNEAPLLAQAIA
jgi:hypothetical protein